MKLLPSGRTKTSFHSQPLLIMRGKRVATGPPCSPLTFDLHSLTSPLVISVSRHLLFFILSQLLCLSSHSSPSAFVGSDLVLTRGVPLMKRSLYNPNLQTFTCLDKSRVIPTSQVNDDYCDCRDGSDEPGTSACPQGTFYCANFQYTPQVIPSSRVNDGICDCCDGSDEWRGLSQCTNICQELGKVLREKAEAALNVKREGWKKRLEYSALGRKENEERRLKLAELKTQKDEIQVAKEAAEALKNEAEAIEKEAKDKHEAVWELLKASKREEHCRLVAAAAFTELDTSEDGVLTPVELLGRHDLDADGDGELSNDEAVQLLGHQGTPFDEFLANVWPKIESKFIPTAHPFDIQAGEEDHKENTEDISQESQPVVDVSPDAPQVPSLEVLPEADPVEELPGDGVDEGYGEDEDEDGPDDEEDDDVYGVETPPPVKEPPHEEKEKEEEAELGVTKPEFDQDTLEKIDAADKARAAFNDVDTKFRDLERDVNELDKITGLDLGRAYEFAPHNGKCFEFTDREYTYKLCMYDRVSQVPKNGGGETSLGTFTSWENDYQLMKYEHGQGCWNGPNRSTKVFMSCGTEDVITAVTEPSRCEYEFRMSTPAVCDTPEQQSEGEPNVKTPPESLDRIEL